MAILVLTYDGVTLKQIQLDRPEIRIGRRTDSDIYLDDMLVSQNHAVVEMHDRTEAPGQPDFYIRDLGSTNHTYVNGDPVESKKLAHNDVIVIGRHTFKFIDDAAAQGDKTTELKKSWIPGVFYTKE